MRIAIDARILVSNFKGGILSYTHELLKELGQIDSRNEYDLLFTGLRLKAADIAVPPLARARNFVLPLPDRAFPGKELLWHEVALRGYFLARRPAVYHLPALHELPSSRLTKRIITVHDLRTLHQQEDKPQDMEALRRSCRLADLIIVVSEFTRDDLLRWDPSVREEKVRMIPLGYDLSHRPLPAATVDAFRAARGLDRPYLFSLGLVPRKNIDRLLQAYAGLRQKDDVQLVLGGHLGPSAKHYQDYVREHGLERHVRFAGSITDEELPLYYNGALAFVFPSLCEGFGIPVLEAMACGTPVVTANDSALPEVSGDAALLVDPLDVAAIRAAMERVVEDGALRAALREKGLRNVQRYSWRTMAQSILAEYERLGG